MPSSREIFPTQGLNLGYISKFQIPNGVFFCLWSWQKWIHRRIYFVSVFLMKRITQEPERMTPLKQPFLASHTLQRTGGCWENDCISAHVGVGVWGGPGICILKASAENPYMGDTILLTKVHTVKAMDFLVVMFKCESWTITKSEKRRIDALKLCC